jgi:hypothetical protein
VNHLSGIYATGIALATATLLACAAAQGGAQAIRDGTLQAGDEAPDFTLKTLDGSAEVQLSSYRGECPVALVFGSYT